MVERVLATAAVLTLIEKLKTLHGPLVFHQSAGCSYGSAPMCQVALEFTPGRNDVLLGEIGGCPVYMDADKFENYQHAQLTVDVTAGHGSAFSMETPEGVRFLTRSRDFTDRELVALRAPEQSDRRWARHKGGQSNG